MRDVPTGIERADAFLDGSEERLGVVRRRFRFRLGHGEFYQIEGS
jgi:hypothetical protein